MSQVVQPHALTTRFGKETSQSRWLGCSERVTQGNEGTGSCMSCWVGSCSFQECRPTPWETSETRGPKPSMKNGRINRSLLKMCAGWRQTEQYDGSQFKGNWVLLFVKKKKLDFFFLKGKISLSERERERERRYRDMKIFYLLLHSPNVPTKPLRSLQLI